jgi:hypothetical protein
VNREPASGPAPSFSGRWSVSVGRRAGEPGAVAARGAGPRRWPRWSSRPGSPRPRGAASRRCIEATRSGARCGGAARRGQPVRLERPGTAVPRRRTGDGPAGRGARRRGQPVRLELAGTAVPRQRRPEAPCLFSQGSGPSIAHARQRNIPTRERTTALVDSSTPAGEGWPRARRLRSRAGNRRGSGAACPGASRSREARTARTSAASARAHPIAGGAIGRRHRHDVQEREKERPRPLARAGARVRRSRGAPPTSGQRPWRPRRRSSRTSSRAPRRGRSGRTGAPGCSRRSSPPGR